MAGSGYDISASVSEAAPFKSGDFSVNNGLRLDWKIIAMIMAVLLLALIVWKKLR